MANGASTITSISSDTRTFSHTGAEIGDDNVSLSQNVTGNNGPVLTWTMPKKYKKVTYAAGKHMTRAELRTKETIAGTANDDTVVSLESNIQPIAGEEDLDEQPYPVAVVYNVTQGTEVDIADVNYAQNELTLATDPADGDTVAIWPILNEGSVQYRALDQFGHTVGPLDEWGVPVHVFNDFDQEKNMTEIHLVGAGEFRRAEKLALFIDSPQQIVWEDADYPRGQYASQVEQRVDVRV